MTERLRLIALVVSVIQNTVLSILRALSGCLKKSATLLLMGYIKYDTSSSQLGHCFCFTFREVRFIKLVSTSSNDGIHLRSESVCFKLPRSIQGTSLIDTSVGGCPLLSTEVYLKSENDLVYREQSKRLRELFRN